MKPAPEAEPMSEPEEPWPRGSPDQLELFFASVCAAARRLPIVARAQLQRNVLDNLLRAEMAADES